MAAIVKLVGYMEEKAGLDLVFGGWDIEMDQGVDMFWCWMGSVQSVGRGVNYISEPGRRRRKPVWLP